MARLDIYENPIEEDRAAFPYVMEIQSDLLYRFVERVCVPLAAPDAFPGMTERLNPPLTVRESAVLSSIGGELVKYQCKAHGQFGRKKQRLAVQGKSNMAVRSEFGEQQIPDVAAAAVDPGDQIVGRGQRPYPLVDAGPDLWLILQHLMKDGVNCRYFVF